MKNKKWLIWVGMGIVAVLFIIFLLPKLGVQTFAITTITQSDPINPSSECFAGEIKCCDSINVYNCIDGTGKQKWKCYPITFVGGGIWARHGIIESCQSINQDCVLNSEKCIDYAYYKCVNNGLGDSKWKFVERKSTKCGYGDGEPTPPPSDCHTGSNGGWSYCSSSCPCGEGEGDCDSDAQCNVGLKCVDNVGANYGFSSSVDVCEKETTKECPPILPGLWCVEGVELCPQDLDENGCPRWRCDLCEETPTGGKWVRKGYIDGECGYEVPKVCTEGAIQGETCVGNIRKYQKCINNQWVDKTQTCSNKCSGGKCVDCISGEWECRNTYTKYVCENNVWKSKGKVIGYCQVECLSGQYCENKYLWKCENYKYVNKGLSSECGYVEAECVEGSSWCEGNELWHCLNGKKLLKEYCSYKCEQS